MKSIEAHQYKQLLSNLFDKTKLLSDDLELQSHWARYLCVLVSGYIEVSVRAMYSEYSRERAVPNVANFIDSHLKGFQNPNMEKVLELTRRFNPEWEVSLRVATEGELKDSVDSVVAVRNQIAHGRSVGITYVRIRRYYDDIEKVIALINANL
jgi:hypothetical protein